MNICECCGRNFGCCTKKDQLIEKLDITCIERRQQINKRDKRIEELKAALNQAYCEQAAHGYNSLETFELMGKVLKEVIPQK